MNPRAMAYSEGEINDSALRKRRLQNGRSGEGGNYSGDIELDEIQTKD